MLSELGYRVLRAKDAQSALAIVESGVPIDMLFTDVVMPGPLRSPELARKARERLPDIAVLFTSGYTDNAIVHGGRLDAGIELLSKPYTREALARKFRHVLRNRLRRKETAAAGPVAETPSRQPGVPPLRALRVLVVDDEPLIRFWTVELLVRLGHTVSEAGTASEALSLLDAETVDALVTDIGLPDMSGSELAAQARRRIPSVRIVFATGRDVLPTERGGAGFEGAVLLVKPYDAETLAAALRSVTA
jgi:CheY-like chemotaxis protein